VYDGAGISPDVAVKEVPMKETVAALLGKFYVFNYATLYATRHPKLRDSTNFELNPEEYKDFLAYLKAEEFSYQTRLEKEMEKIKKEALENSGFETIRNEYEVLMARLKVEKDNELLQGEKEIRKILSEEIISRYYFQKGRLAFAMRNDEQINQSLELIKNETEMNSILTRKEKANKPFNASKKF
jgi:carboxyl-terminal processing protease